MNASVIVVFICFILSGFFHQGLYLIFPFLTFFYISYQNKSRLKLNPVSKIYLYIALVAFALFLIQSILYFDIKIFSLKGCLRYIAYFSFAVFISYMTKENIRFFFVILITYFVLTFPVSIFQTVNIGRYQNLVGHSNHLAYILSMLIYFLLFNKPFRNKKINIVSIILISVSLILTQSTAGLLIIVALLAYNGFVSNQISILNKFLFTITPIVGVILAINISEKIAFQFESLNYLNLEFIEDRAFKFTEDGIVRAGGHGSFIWRIIYWFSIVHEFLSESITKITFGLGVDHLTQGNMPYKFLRQDPHNDFVKALVEFGAIGLLLFISFFYKVFKIVKKNFNIIILMIVPAFFGNPTINFSVTMTLILILMYEYKKVNTEVD